MEVGESTGNYDGKCDIWEECHGYKEVQVMAEPSSGPIGALCASWPRRLRVSAGVLVCSRPLPPRRARNPAVHKGNPAARHRCCIISLDEVSAAAVRDRITSGWDDLSTVPPAIGLTCGVHWSFRFV